MREWLLGWAIPVTLVLLYLASKPWRRPWYGHEDLPPAHLSLSRTPPEVTVRPECSVTDRSGRLDNVVLPVAACTEPGYLLYSAGVDVALIDEDGQVLSVAVDHRPDRLRTGTVRIAPCGVIRRFRLVEYTRTITWG